MLVGVRRDDRELLAADPGRSVPAALALEDGHGNTTQRLVSRSVSEAVVDLLEAVEVAENHAQGRLGSPGALDLDFERLFEAAPVEQLGERVATRCFAQVRDHRADAVPCDRDENARARQRADRGQPAGRGRVVGIAKQQPRERYAQTRHLGERPAPGEAVKGIERRPQVGGADRARTLPPKSRSWLWRRSWPSGSRRETTREAGGQSQRAPGPPSTPPPGSWSRGPPCVSRAASRGGRKPKRSWMGGFLGRSSIATRRPSPSGPPRNERPASNPFLGQCRVVTGLRQCGRSAT